MLLEGRELSHELAVGAEHEGRAVEHQLILAADLVNIDQRQGCFDDARDGEVEPDVELFRCRTASR